MNTTGNTILITGGGSGIGRGLAEAFHALGNKVVIAGRRKAALEETTSANPGMSSIELDVEDPASVRSVAELIRKEHPRLNVLINNAGIMRPEKLVAQPDDLADAETIVAINLLGPMRLIAALLPLLREQSSATIINVSSGLAFVPMSITPTYCATKAAIHSYTQSLRYQLKGTSIEVLEIIPPYVATDLMGGASDPRAMPLKEFIAETMALLNKQLAEPEICVEGVKPLRFAAESGNFATVFKTLNDAMSEHH